MWIWIVLPASPPFRQFLWGQFVPKGINIIFKKLTITIADIYNIIVLGVKYF